jgi:hypothetical protein
LDKREANCAFKRSVLHKGTAELGNSLPILRHLGVLRVIAYGLSEVQLGLDKTIPSCFHAIGFGGILPNPNSRYLTCWVKVANLIAGMVLVSLG